MTFTSLTKKQLSTAEVLIGAANDIDAYKDNPGVLSLVADRLRRYAVQELGYVATKENQS